MTGARDGEFAAVPGIGLDEQRPLRPQRPSVARIYDFLLGGDHNRDVDRRAAATVLAQMPALRGVLRADRAFLGRVMRHLLRVGIRQFLDLGSGIPAVGPAHELAPDPTVRVVYVDCDPDTVVTGRQILAGVPRATMIQADLRAPQQVLRHPRLLDLLDLTQPVGILMIGVLHLVADHEDPAGIVAHLFDALAPGSFLAVSHMGPVERQTPPGMIEAKNIYSRCGGALHPRSHEEIAAVLGDWQVQPPGMVPVPLWRPDPGTEPLAADVTFPGIAALAYKPVPPPAGAPHRADRPPTARRVPSRRGNGQRI